MVNTQQLPNLQSLGRLLDESANSNTFVVKVKDKLVNFFGLSRPKGQGHPNVKIHILGVISRLLCFRMWPVTALPIYCIHTETIELTECLIWLLSTRRHLAGNLHA